MLKGLVNRETTARNDLLKALPKNAVGVEVGVWRGEFSSLLFKVTSPRKLHLIDPWIVSTEEDRSDEAWYGAAKISQKEMDEIHDQVTQKFAAPIKSGQVEVHRAPSADAMRKMADESVDYIYIDGDHSYEGVSADLEEAFRITKGSGMICCDDYLLGAWWKDGVVRAVHEFLCAKPVVIYSKANSQIVLRKIAKA